MRLEALEQARRRDPLPAIAAAAGDLPVYLVGGWVRDALLGREPSEIDLTVEGDLGPLLERLDAAAGAARHERFGTASLTVDGVAVDLATSRRERYAEPGALPEVEPAPIRADLARRDFTVNSLAVPLAGALEVLDPYDGLSDLEAGVLRAHHDRSFIDDPTRALRAARYAARLGFTPDPRTLELLRQADLAMVSADRVEAELHRIAAEPNARAAFALLADWGLLDQEPGAFELIEALERLLGKAPWADLAPRAEAIHAALGGPTPGARALCGAPPPPRPSAARRLVKPHLARPLDLLMARALGAEWLDRWLAEWHDVELEIDGRDLLKRGASEGPALGAALERTLDAVLDGELPGDREAQLSYALAQLGDPR